MAGVLFWGFCWCGTCASALAMDAKPQQPRWTLDAFREGAMATMPLLPGLCAFGIAFGTVAARKGFSLLDACLMSAAVFSGVAQIIVVDAWPHELTAADDLRQRRDHRAHLLALHPDRRVDAAVVRRHAGTRPRLFHALPAGRAALAAWHALLQQRRPRSGLRARQLRGVLAVLGRLDRARLLARRLDRRSAALRPRSHHAGLLRRHAGLDVARAAPRRAAGSSAALVAVATRNCSAASGTW